MEKYLRFVNFSYLMSTFKAQHSVFFTQKKISLMNNDIMYNYNNRTLQCIKNELFFSKIYRRPVFSGL